MPTDMQQLSSLLIGCSLHVTEENRQTCISVYTTCNCLRYRIWIHSCRPLTTWRSQAGKGKTRLIMLVTFTDTRFEEKKWQTLLNLENPTLVYFQKCLFCFAYLCLHSGHMFQGKTLVFSNSICRSTVLNTDSQLFRFQRNNWTVQSTQQKCKKKNCWNMNFTLTWCPHFSLFINNLGVVSGTLHKFNEVINTLRYTY